MAYLKKEIALGDVVEVSKYTNGRFGIREIKEKAPSQRSTPEEQLKWQSKQATKKVWRLLRNKANFSPGDMWVTLTYPPKTKPDSETVRKHITELLKRLRRAYKKAGKICKYIYSVGRGARGAIHFHVFLPFCLQNSILYRAQRSGDLLLQSFPTRAPAFFWSIISPL